MAYVLSSVSGNLISAASAGYAPTNSADVSAIASAYQVVSATGTKFYNGTYYLTSVNDNQLSAKYAVSASSATAAFYARYDRLGGVVRSLSSLPGSAEVSAIASSYAESAVSGKADSSALSSYVPYSSLEYNTASAISGINGSALAAGSTYSAGEGIDITDDVISVETPVDIVAGPGIVIDNPDGNTLRVSTDENYEVELYYSPTNHNVATDAEFAMSESIWNFSKVLITFDNMEFENRNCTMLIDLAVANTGTYFTTPYCNGDVPGTLNICWASFNINAAGNIKYLNRGLIFGTWTAPAFTTGTSRGYRVKRVVGINRINGGN